MFTALLRRTLQQLPAGTLIPMLHPRLLGLRWVHGAGIHRVWMGFYEPRLTRVVQQVLRPNAVFYDVGSHVGYYALLASRLVGRGGVVIAFEPAPANLILLRRHIAINRLTNVLVKPVALGNQSRLARFDVGANPYTGHLAEGGATVVRQVSLDEYIASEQLPPPAVLKIDVEGAEAEVLMGAQRILRQHRPAVVLATHSADLNMQCVSFMSELGYSTRPLDTIELADATEILALHDGSAGRGTSQVQSADA